jgi:alanine racemase
MKPHLVWAEIDLTAIAHNICALKQATHPETRLMAVVKANAYGHGYREVAAKALECGVESLGVARVDEAVKLRKAGFDIPVLIFGITPPCHVETLLKYDLTQTVSSLKGAQLLSDIAVQSGKKIRVHVKVDTGMGRLGIQPVCRRADSKRFAIDETAVKEVESIVCLPGLEPEGIYTHFATADSSDKSYAHRQFEIFMAFLDALNRSGIHFSVRHAANSAGIIDMPDTHLDMVRAGISLYGLYPSGEVDKNRVALKPAMALKTRIAHLKKVPAGFKISYGITYETKKPTTIATVPIGYADGYSRRLSSSGNMLVCGQNAPVVGRVCMDQIMLDVGHIPEADLDDEVVVFGTQGDQTITAEAVAEAAGAINYEVVAAIAARVPRVYIL